MNKYCDIEIKFADTPANKVYKLGETVHGTILIYPKVDFEIVQLGYELQGVFNIETVLSERKTSIEKSIVLENSTLKKGKPLSIDFAVKNESLEDYKGRGFEFTSELLVFIQTKKGSKLNSKNWIKKAVPLKFNAEGLGFEVASNSVILQMEEPLVILGAIFFFLLFICLQPGHPIIIYPIVFVGLVILTLIGHNIYRAFFIGNVQAQFKTIDDENFGSIRFCVGNVNPNFQQLSISY